MPNLTPHDVIATLESISRDIQKTTEEMEALDKKAVMA